MDVTDIVTELIETILKEDVFRVPGPHENYRCKATYSLYPRFCLSETVLQSVNEVCKTLNQFVEKESSFATQYPRFFLEVMCKENRRGELMVKIVFINEVIKEEMNCVSLKQCEKSYSCNTLWEKWIVSKEPENLVSFIQKKHPCVLLIVGHVNLQPLCGAGGKGLSKPTKASSYIPLTPHSSCTLQEVTPNQKVYEISPDSFCEVNHIMEEKMFYYVCDVLKLESDLGVEATDVSESNVILPSHSDISGKISQMSTPKSTRHLFLSGRDVLAMFASFESFYSSVHCVTSCPSVFEDAKRHPIHSCMLRDKNKVAEGLREFNSMDTTGSHHIIFTSGRHGLHPSTLVELLNMRKKSKFVTDLIYISCNKGSLARDFHVLKEGFRVENIAVFDFFPQTSYEMTVVHWKPYNAVEMHGSLLVIPVGPSGSGKTISGAALKKTFSTPVPADIIFVNHISTEDRFYKLRDQTHFDSSIPRRFLQVESSLTVSIFQRDLFFKGCRDHGLPLKKSKAETHAALLEFLSNSSPRELVYIDSTNTHQKARTLYSEVWKTNWYQSSNPIPGSVRSSSSSSHPLSPHGTSSVLEIHFQCRDPKELLDRVQQRIDHPSFPTATEDQVRKVSVILDALQKDNDEMDYSTVPVNKFAIDNLLTENRTLKSVQFVVCAHLFFSPSIARTMCHAMRHCQRL